MSQSMRSVLRLLHRFSDAVIRAVSSIAAAPVSNRGLAVLGLAGCVLLITGPWLRPPLSRDFRGLHIPIGELTSVSFVPELTAAAPRPLRWDSIAMPLLAVVGAGVVLVLIQPRWTGRVFGLLLALSVPAVAISLWNYPALSNRLKAICGIGRCCGRCSANIASICCLPARRIGWRL